MRTCYQALPGIIETDLDDELILLDPATQQMFSLNAAGRTVWRHLARGGLAAAAASLRAAYGLSPETAQADARALVEGLVGAGLLRQCAGPDAA